MIREMKTLPRANCVIVGEPTLLKLVDGHKASIGLIQKLQVLKFIRL